jgi:hypothetical protein
MMMFRVVRLCVACRKRPRMYSRTKLCIICNERILFGDLRELDKQLEYWYADPPSGR